MSTEMAAYDLISKILNALSNRNRAGGTRYDLRTAFDCVMTYCYLPEDNLRLWTT